MCSLVVTLRMDFVAGPTKTGVEPTISHLWKKRALRAPIMDVRLSLICLFFFLQSLYIRENIVNISKNVQLKIHKAF